MKDACVLICLLVVSSGAFAKCGPRFTRDVNKPVTVTLTGTERGAAAAPAFYLRIFANPNREIVIFFMPDDVIEELERQQKSAPTEAHNTLGREQRSYLDSIRTDLPLKGDTDLFKYALRNGGNISRQQALVEQLLRSGRAAIRDVPSDVDMKTITMVEKRPEENGNAAARWFCARDGLPLFEFYNEIVD